MAKSPSKSTFDTFGQAEWRDWLNKFLLNLPSEPSVPVRDGDVVEALISLFRRLPTDESRHWFGEAVVELLAATPLLHNSAERLSHLVELVDYCKPLSGRPLINYLLTVEALWGIQYGNTILHYAVLNAASTYGVDEKLVSYVLRNATVQRPFEYLVLAFRILSVSMNARVTYYFLERIIPHLKSDREERFLRRELKEAIRRNGCTDLVYFAIDRGWQLRPDFPSQVERFGGLLQSSVANSIRISDILEIAKNSDRYVRSEMIYVLGRLHEFVIPATGVPSWDILDNDVTGFGRPGACQLYTSEEIVLLFKESDQKLIDLFEEAKAETIEEKPRYLRDFDADDEAFMRLIGIAGSEG